MQLIELKGVELPVKSVKFETECQTQDRLLKLTSAFSAAIKAAMAGFGSGKS